MRENHECIVCNVYYLLMGIIFRMLIFYCICIIFIMLILYSILYLRSNVGVLCVLYVMLRIYC